MAESEGMLFEFATVVTQGNIFFQRAERTGNKKTFNGLGKSGIT